MFITSSLAPQLTDIGVNAAHLGLAVAAYFGMSSVTAPIGGRLADRVGSVRVMRAALVLAAACLLAIGLLVNGWVSLVIAVGTCGVVNGAIQPAANRYVGQLTPSDRQGFAFGIKQAAIPTAILVGGISVPAAVHLTGWRVIYLVAAAAAIAVAFAIPKPPARRRRRQAASRETSRELDRRPLVVLAVGWAIASAGANALGAFFVLGAVHAGFTPVDAALLAVAGSIASIVVRVGVGFLADRWLGGGLGVVAVMSGVGAVSVALLATGSVPAFLLAVVVGYGVGWGWAGLANYAVVQVHPSQPGKATGITQAGAGAGACAGPLAFGVVVSGVGFELAWVIAGATLLLAVGVILTGRTMLPARATAAK